MTSDQTEGRRIREEGRIDWVGGIIASIVFAVLIASLYFVVPKLEASWKNSGMTPPLFGRFFISMKQHLEIVLLLGVVLVGRSFRRRA
jgi:type II secretory pathway component PulF